MGYSPRNPPANQVFKLYGSLPAKLKNPKNGVGSVTQMSGVNPESNPEGNQGVNPEVKPCVVTTGYQGMTHTRTVHVIFSLKKNKFIRPIRIEGSRVTGKYIYELYPGKYLQVGYQYFARQYPSRQIYAQYISINHDCSVVYGQSTVILFETVEWLMNQAIPQILKDLFNWRPQYHIEPSIDFNKVYPLGEVAALVKMIDSKVRLIEGEEHE